jgi:hypothetical protein
MEATNGEKDDVVVEVTKKAKTNDKGNLYTDYEITVSNDNASSTTNPFEAAVKQDDSDLNSVEKQFINDAKSTKEQAPDKITKEIFVNTAESNYNIKKERAEELWDKYM